MITKGVKHLLFAPTKNAEKTVPREVIKKTGKNICESGHHCSGTFRNNIFSICNCT